MSLLEVSVAAGASGPVLVLADEAARTRNGSVTLLNSQPAEARILDLLRAGEMFCIRSRAARETQPDTSADGS